MSGGCPHTLPVPFIKKADGGDLTGTGFLNHGYTGGSVNSSSYEQKAQKVATDIYFASALYKAISQH